LRTRCPPITKRTASRPNSGNGSISRAGGGIGSNGTPKRPTRGCNAAAASRCRSISPRGIPPLPPPEIDAIAAQPSSAVPRASTLPSTRGRQPSPHHRACERAKPPAASLGLFLGTVPTRPERLWVGREVNSACCEELGADRRCRCPEHRRPDLTRLSDQGSVYRESAVAAFRDTAARNAL
jgi:hypothetical protein